MSTGRTKVYNVKNTHTRCSFVIAENLYELGQPRYLIFGLIGDAPVNITHWDAIFLHRIDHAPTNKRNKARLEKKKMFEGYDRYKRPEKNTKTAI